MECSLSLESIGREIGTWTHGSTFWDSQASNRNSWGCILSLEIHWQGNRNSWGCILRFIGWEIGTWTHGNAFWDPWQDISIQNAHNILWTLFDHSILCAFILYTTSMFQNDLLLVEVDNFGTLIIVYKMNAPYILWTFFDHSILCLFQWMWFG